ncbi:hypothetical protein PTSG_04296 [Salpingoeca rosetta]|uniref:Uncharacterized protein n=1 Tax=Salpingoeca rosetta (strain ATCC 50818 / BSB-021) TaxID=946362 RepID=F2U759_SALR5|nr:uncharacterized protein PTSG_04296 [Salpingoeca rosetta]EGD83691.1 hypothetical protein PTSG_04296 [Salpingoeca rosetta]|eukprot:XP_004995195.1 hypothetical protein PTSG_04296 [Salpingoeca rosetta]
MAQPFVLPISGSSKTRPCFTLFRNRIMVFCSPERPRVSRQQTLNGHVAARTRHDAAAVAGGDDDADPDNQTAKAPKLVESGKAVDQALSSVPQSHAGAGAARGQGEGPRSAGADTTAPVATTAGDRNDGSASPPLSPETRHAIKIAQLTKRELKRLINDAMPTMKAIFRGEQYSERHEAFKRGGQTRGHLRYSVFFGSFTGQQREFISSKLTKVFCARSSKYLPYTMDVLLPELLKEIYKKVLGLSSIEAESELGVNKRPNYHQQQ